MRTLDVIFLRVLVILLSCFFPCLRSVFVFLWIFHMASCFSIVQNLCAICYLLCCLLHNRAWRRGTLLAFFFFPVHLKSVTGSSVVLVLSVASVVNSLYGPGEVWIELCIMSFICLNDSLHIFKMFGWNRRRPLSWQTPAFIKEPQLGDCKDVCQVALVDLWRWSFTGWRQMSYKMVNRLFFSLHLCGVQSILQWSQFTQSHTHLYTNGRLLPWAMGAI